jgi:hypothetical protein
MGIHVTTLNDEWIGIWIISLYIFMNYPVFIWETVDKPSSLSSEWVQPFYNTSIATCIELSGEAARASF